MNDLPEEIMSFKFKLLFQSKLGIDFVSDVEILSV